MDRCQDLAYLHPLSIPKFQRLLDRLHAGYHQKGGTSSWFMPFETYRTPSRQKVLYDQGRANPGRIVTNAKPWESPHQFGLAVDFVPRRPKDPNNPTGSTVWDWDFATDKDWAFLASCAADCDLHCPIVWDRPHVEDTELWDDFRTIINYRSK